ncbi:MULTISPECIES: aminodeoxychorismate lyase [Shouchella]|uniref:Aminodeoxychorismate lyase n=2 Tax=Shouchella TaxID=2893057 RepID=A0ABY7W9P5_9BACI|nr:MULTISPECIES: aminodeoxychorismate lyase [Shouchella]MED4126818.1 aminodeoxychorismate lyase [Shouchella miscanthi]WDF05418.1 aminodeoxychorismate lyase [Shouchella hunanensis]
MYISVNGQIVQDTEASISPYDHGFLYGLGLFETFAVRNDAIFLLDHHLTRLNVSVKELGFNYVLTEDVVYRTVRKLLKKNGLQEAYIRWNVSAGIREIGLANEPFLDPQEIVYVKVLPPLPVAAKRLVSLKLNRNSIEGIRRYKSHHYLNNVLAKKELGNQPNTEGLFYTAEGYAAEGIVSNLFFVKNDSVYTPSLETGILNGVTRQYVIAWCEQNQKRVEEGFYTKEEIAQADEVFLTNAIQGIVAVHTFDHQSLPSNTITEQLATSYQLAIKMEERIENE